MNEIDPKDEMESINSVRMLIKISLVLSFIFTFLWILEWISLDMVLIGYIPLIFLNSIGVIYFLKVYERSIKDDVSNGL